MLTDVELVEMVTVDILSWLLKEEVEEVLGDSGGDEKERKVEFVILLKLTSTLQKRPGLIGKGSQASFMIRSIGDWSAQEQTAASSPQSNQPMNTITNAKPPFIAHHQKRHAYINHALYYPGLQQSIFEG